VARRGAGSSAGGAVCREWSPAESEVSHAHESQAKSKANASPRCRRLVIAYDSLVYVGTAGADMYKGRNPVAPCKPPWLKRGPCQDVTNRRRESCRGMSKGVAMGAVKRTPCREIRPCSPVENRGPRRRLGLAATWGRGRERGVGAETGAPVRTQTASLHPESACGRTNACPGLDQARG